MYTDNIHFLRVVSFSGRRLALHMTFKRNMSLNFCLSSSKMLREITLNFTASLSKNGSENILPLSRTKVHTSRTDICLISV